MHSISLPLGQLFRTQPSLNRNVILSFISFRFSLVMPGPSKQIELSQIIFGKRPATLAGDFNINLMIKLTKMPILS